MTFSQTRPELIFDLPMVRYTAQPDGQPTRQIPLDRPLASR